MRDKALDSPADTSAPDELDSLSLIFKMDQLNIGQCNEPKP